MQVHLAGQLAINIDQQKQSGNTGNQVQGVALLFILILLLLIFRSVLAPFITLIPAVLSVTDRRPDHRRGRRNHGLKVSSLAQLLLIVLVLGAGTDYGLFLVFRVRENMRARPGQPRSRGQRADQGRASRSRSPPSRSSRRCFRCCRELRDLLRPRHPAGDRHRRDAAGRPDAAARAAGDLRPGRVLAVEEPSRRVDGRRCGARSPPGSSSGPGVTLVIGVIAFGALSVAVIGVQSAGFGGTISAPGGHRLRRRAPPC